MEHQTAYNKAEQEKWIWFFLAGWTVLNAAQAAAIGVHADEAYYWLYSQFLAWGYYDHPPMVALFIKAGYALFNNEFGLRLVTIITSTLSLRILWLILRSYRINAQLFILIVGSTFIFHIYGFITTPDVPLFFFTVVFYRLFQQYLKKDSVPLAALIGVCLACLLYSKYHAVLLIIITVAANLSLLRRTSFWVILLMATALFAPHLYWQYIHGWPSVDYHLHERSSQVYNFSHTYLFIPGQLLMAGPLVGWVIFYYAFSTKIKDAFTRTLMANAIATIIFFLLNTVKGNVQPHWTLIAFVPITLLALIKLGGRLTIPVWFRVLATVNLSLIVFFRLAMVAQLAPVKKIKALRSFYNYQTWGNQVKSVAGDDYMLISGGFQDPSKYCFYTKSLKGFAYDSRFYRRTQFELWPLEDNFQGKETIYFSGEPNPAILKDSIYTVNGTMWYTRVQQTRTYQRVLISSDKYKVKAAPGEAVIFKLNISNPYPFPINFSNKGQTHVVTLEASIMKDDVQIYQQQSGKTFNNLTLASGESKPLVFTLNTPKIKGTFDLIFSLRTTPFPGGRNSRIINFTVQ